MSVDVLTDSSASAVGSVFDGDGLGTEARYSVVKSVEDEGVTLVEGTSDNDDGEVLEDEGVELMEDEGEVSVANVEDEGVAFVEVEERFNAAKDPPCNGVQLDDDGEELYL